MSLLRLAPFALITVVFASCSDPVCHPNEVKVGTSCQEINKNNEDVDSGGAALSSDAAAVDPRGNVGSRDAGRGVLTDPNEDGVSDTAKRDAGKQPDGSGKPDQAGEADASAVPDESAKPDAETKPVTPVRDSGTAAMTPNDCTAKKGTACTAGSGDCQGTGVWDCDPANPSSLHCTAVEKPKNACGLTCGPLSEDCSTPADDNCNGQANEGCCVPTAEICDGKDNNCNNSVDEGGICVCGDGIVSAGEACDPKAAGWTYWSCSKNCDKQTIYRPCVKDTDCAPGKGETCAPFGTCTRRCTNYGVTGGFSGCPEAPPGLTSMCIGNAESGGICIASGCTAGQNQICDIGQSCDGNNLYTFCFGCKASLCPAPFQCRTDNSGRDACQ
ncbi:MAG TPA: hypothetical protein VI299_25180 [Polyangiales bacterium]